MSALLGREDRGHPDGWHLTPESAWERRAQLKAGQGGAMGQGRGMGGCRAGEWGPVGQGRGGEAERQGSGGQKGKANQWWSDGQKGHDTANLLDIQLKTEYLSLLGVCETEWLKTSLAEYSIIVCVKIK